jgi:predicted RNA polymerase sigma factor
VATLILQAGDWDLAEGCAQEAFTRAQRRWPAHGIPQRPSAWYGHAEWAACIQPQQYSTGLSEFAPEIK